MAPRRDLPTLQEAAQILTAKRTRPQRRPPPPMGRALNRTLKAFDAEFGQGSGALEARWSEVVGKEIAKRTEPVKLTKGRNGGPVRAWTFLQPAWVPSTLRTSNPMSKRSYRS